MTEGYATNGSPVWPDTDTRWTFLLDVALAESTQLTFLEPERNWLSMSALSPGSPCWARGPYTQSHRDPCAQQQPDNNRSALRRNGVPHATTFPHKPHAGELQTTHSRDLGVSG
jgi:hypothetical protein